MSRTPSAMAGMLSRAGRIAAPLRGEADAHDLLHPTPGKASSGGKEAAARPGREETDGRNSLRLWGRMLFVRNELRAFQITPACVAESLRTLEDEVLPGVRRLCGLEPRTTPKEPAARRREKPKARKR